MIAASAAMREVLARLPAIARAHKTTLICGPTGSGKEVVARTLHEQGSTCQAPYVAVHCGALPEHLVEAELFGHTRGAFTGATQSRAGLIRSAAGGTLFLDEVDSLTVTVQTKLLRFLETGEFRPVGSDRSESGDAWVIAAANHSLEDEVQNGRFRADLLYRLDVMRIDLPPLRLRGSDVELLAVSFLPQTEKQLSFSIDAIRALHKYDWPGNVRELKHRVERAVVLCPGDVIDAELLGLSGAPRHAEARPDRAAAVEDGTDVLGRELWALIERDRLTLSEAVEHCEDAIIRFALRAEQDNRTRAAERLRIHVRTLFKKLHH